MIGAALLIWSPTEYSKIYTLESITIELISLNTLRRAPIIGHFVILMTKKYLEIMQIFVKTLVGRTVTIDVES